MTEKAFTLVLLDYITIKTVFVTIVTTECQKIFECPPKVPACTTTF